MVTRPYEHLKLDAKDRRILQLVQRDGASAQAEIAKKVGLSTAAVNERLRKLEASGVIRRWTALVRPEAVGASITAFVEVFIENPRFESAFLERVTRLNEVQECHHVTGEFRCCSRCGCATWSRCSACCSSSSPPTTACGRPAR